MRLGGGPAHQRRMLANLSVSLFEHKSIKTTLTKAKRLQPYAERLVSFAKQGDLPARRKVQGLIAGNSRPTNLLYTSCLPSSAQLWPTVKAATPVSPRSATVQAITRQWLSSNWSWNQCRQSRLLLQKQKQSPEAAEEAPSRRNC